MKLITKILIGLAVLALSPIVIGMFQPKEKVLMDKVMIDKMYFFILGDITNHWEEPSWRTDIDTLIQQEDIDGQAAWKEFYTNGDSVTLITLQAGQKDYIRMIVDPDGRYRNRAITLVDIQGKTAIRISEEVYEANPLKRFMYMFNDPRQQHLTNYVIDLAEKNKPDPNAEENQYGSW
jgi:hypothetical protein